MCHFLLAVVCLFVYHVGCPVTEKMGLHSVLLHWYVPCYYFQNSHGACKFVGAMTYTDNVNFVINIYN